MITITQGAAHVFVPSQWEDLSQGQYIALVPLIMKFTQGDLSIDEVKVGWLTEILNAPPQTVKFKDRNTYTHNLLHISDQITFFYKFKYDKSLHSVISAELWQKIAKHHPSTLPVSPEVLYVSRQPCDLMLDALIPKNLMTSISLDGVEIEGWDAQNLKAGVFLTCLDLISNIGSNPYIIKDITELLYPHTPGWSNSLSHEMHYAILFNFQSFANYLFKKTRFSMLFRESDKTKTNTLSNNIDNLYYLCKKGYGNSLEIENITVLQYFTILLNELFDAARSMHSMDKSVVEIADTLNLKVEEVLTICG